MKTYKDFIKEEHIDESIKDEFEFFKTLDDLIINLRNKGSAGKRFAARLENIAYELEDNFSNSGAKSELLEILKKLPADVNLNILSDLIKKYLK